jgi:hypothetical protein
MAKTLYTLEVVITEGMVNEKFAEANPVVSRTIEIRGLQTLWQLHRTIFRAFDRWDDCHMCEFQFGSGPHEPDSPRYVLSCTVDGPFDDRPAAGTIEKTRLDDLNLEVGRSFGYWYDFGDNWYHQIDIIAIGQPEAGRRYPRVIAQVEDNPPQYMDWDEEGDHGE